MAGFGQFGEPVHGVAVGEREGHWWLLSVGCLCWMILWELLF